MKLDDAEKYRHVEANSDLHLVYYGPQLIGQVRRGIDGHWYPELTSERFKGAALHKVVLAYEAITEMQAALDGHR